MHKFFALFRLSMPFFAGDGAPGGGASDGQTPEQIAEAKKQADQEALNKQFADRAARSAEAERKKILDELGVKDPDEAKKLLQVARDAEAATKTETEKLQAQIATEKAAKEKAEADAKATLETANRRLMDSEIKLVAFKAVTEKDGKVTRPAFRKEAEADVLTALDRSGITEKDGTFENVEKALSALAKAKPWLLEEKQQPTRGTPPGGGRGKQGDGSGNERTPIISSL